MKSEIASHKKRRHWILTKREDVPEGTKTLPAVWAMKRKRKVATGEIYKRKARLNVGGHKQEKHVNFWQTYSPVVGWVTIRFFLILAIIKGWHARQYDFVLAYPQADIEVPLYMDIPRGFDVPKGRNKDYCLRLVKNLFGQKQAGRVWNRHLHKGLIDVGFEQSTVDECLYYKGSTILLVYVDDCIIIDADFSKIQQAFEDLKARGYDMTDEGDLKDYLGVDVDRRSDGTVHLTQPKMINQILRDVFFNERTKPKENPALVGQTLQRSLEEPSHDKTWSYRSIIGKLNFLEKSTRPEMAFASHQAARFSADPRAPHSKAVLHLCRYLQGTRDKGIIYTPDPSLGFEVYADADLAGTWNKETASDDPSTARSRLGYVIRYAGCPIVWASKLIPEICLSTTEAEYCSLSEALRQTIPLMNLLKECQSHGIAVNENEPEVFCTAFEDNSGALVMANTPKIRPRTKHINLKYHHFRSHVAMDGEDNTGKIHIKAIDTKEQLADVFTKAVAQDLFLKFRFLILGW
jgi:hypothetical protein